jgi:hypothetical protein
MAYETEVQSRTGNMRRAGRGGGEKGKEKELGGVRSVPIC